MIDDTDEYMVSRPSYEYPPHVELPDKQHFLRLARLVALFDDSKIKPFTIERSNVGQQTGEH